MNSTAQNTDNRIGMQCKWLNNRTCIGSCYFKITIQWRQGIQLNAVVLWWHESEWRICTYRYIWIEASWGCCFKWRFSIQTFHLQLYCVAITKQVAPYAKFACLDACHLNGKFQGMLICATNQDSNGTIFILALGLVPGEDEENWLYFLRHFQNSGLANSIIFCMSDRDKYLINAVRKVFPDIPDSKCLRHLSKI